MTNELLLEYDSFPKNNNETKCKFDFLTQYYGSV